MPQLAIKKNLTAAIARKKTVGLDCILLHRNSLDLIYSAKTQFISSLNAS